MNQVVIFVHIPKTGGTTLNKILINNYREYCNIYTSGANKILENTSAARIDQLELLSGHFPFGLDQYFAKPCSYITLLREPVERIISHYYYVINSPANYLYQEIKSKKIGLAEYAKGYLSAELNNHQTRLISGMQPYPGQPAQVTAKDLKKAKRNIKESFAVAGITEMFPQSLFLMKKRYQWEKVSYQSENVNRNRPTQEEISPDIIKTIQNNNEFDLKLYQFVKKLLIRQINSLKFSEQEELKDFCQF